MAKATVVIPTHDHGRLLELAGASALAQTVDDLEVFVIGDGATAATRDAATALVARDARVRFFDRPKGPRLGEAHRHDVLADATGDIVCYLADDDLWLPNHVEVMIEILRDADVASARCIKIDERGPMTWRVDLADADDRAFLRTYGNRIPLSAIAHTRAAYRSLASGWTTTPAGMATDWYFLRKLLDGDRLRARTARATTVLHFAQADRADTSAEERERELQTWAGRVADERWRRDELAALEVAAVEGGWCATDDELRRVWAALAAARATPGYRAWVGARHAAGVSLRRARRALARDR